MNGSIDVNVAEQPGDERNLRELTRKQSVLLLVARRDIYLNYNVGLQ